MYPYLFTGLAFACAGGICALVGDLQNRVYLGLAGFLAVNGIIWAKFIMALMSSADLLTAASLFLLSHLTAAMAYLGTVYFLDTHVERRPAKRLAASRD